MTKVTRGPYGTVTATIADSGTTSGAVDLRGRVATHVALPSGFDGTTLEVEGSTDGTNFFDLYDKDNTQITMTVAASRIYQLNNAIWGLPYIRFVAGSQTGAVTLTICLG